MSVFYLIQYIYIIKMHDRYYDDYIYDQYEEENISNYEDKEKR